jgi:hypothetical protein
VAGSLTVNTAILETGKHGPVPSGSFVVHVKFVVPATAEDGVKVVDALVLLPKVPEPAGADQVPVPLDVAEIFTTDVPQFTYGPPVVAVADGLMVIVALLFADTQGPVAPSGSIVVHVMFTGDRSFVPGVYVVFAELALLKEPVPEVVQTPLLLVVALMFTGALLQAVKGPVIDAEAGGFTDSWAVLVTGGHGPAPSGSDVVQVQVIVLPAWLLAGVNVVDAFDAFPKVPVPTGALQDPGPDEVAEIFTVDPAQAE